MLCMSGLKGIEHILKVDLHPGGEADGQEVKPCSA